MNYSSRNPAASISAYRQLSVETEASAASPHRLIGMLLAGARDRLRAARVQIEKGDGTGKGESISSALSIIGALQGSLNLEQGGEIAANLDALYDYMLRTLPVANLENNVERISEIDALIAEIQAGWEGIKPAQ